MLSVQNISVSYGTVAVLKKVTFSVGKGERLVIVGESGCGKTTLLKTIAGQIQPFTGEVLVDKERIKGPNEQLVPGHPKIKLVNQDFGLETFHTVEENIRLRLIQFNKEYIDFRIETLLKVTGLKKNRHQLAHQLSGGQKQRLAIARALADEPEVLLLDEPFNQLDYFLKTKIENYIDAYIKQYNITLVVVSHNAEETMRWGENVMYLNSGKIARIDTPVAFYDNPTNKKEAGFFGVVNTVRIDGKYYSFRPHQFSLGRNHENVIKINVSLERIINKGWYYEHLVSYGKKIIQLYHHKPIKSIDSIFFKPLF
jgi:iron(III) transport system ATP-binding protein